MQPRKFSGRKKKHHRILRHPRTTQERRTWDSHIDQLREFPYEAKIPKRSRSPHNLPNTYDDILRRWINKDWKLYRKTQWKEKY